MTKIITTGILDPYFETGTEGVIWSVYNPLKAGYQGLHILSQDDKLTVFNLDDSIKCTIIIDQDKDTDWQPYPHYVEHGYKGKPITLAEQKEMGLGQPVSLGMWVHWIQKGWDADEWGEMFFHDPPFKAQVER